MNLDPNKRYSLEETINLLTGVTPIVEKENNIEEDVNNPYEPILQDHVDNFTTDRYVNEENEAEAEDLNIFSLDEIEEICYEADELGKSLENDKNITTTFEMGSCDANYEIEEMDIAEIDEENERRQTSPESRVLTPLKDATKIFQNEEASDGRYFEKENDETHFEVTIDVDEIDVEPSKKKKKRTKLDSAQRQLRDKENHPLIAHNCSHKGQGPQQDNDAWLKCHEIDEVTRTNIHTLFWEENIDSRRSWINNMVQTKEPDNRRSMNHREQKIDRKVTRLYHLYTGSGDKVRVCKRFFLATIGYTSEKVIIYAKSKSLGKFNPSPDKRGKKEPPNKFSKDLLQKIHEHILLYNPCITHYRRTHAPNRLYISPMYSSRIMHKDFIEQNPDQNVSHTRYYQEIKSKNIGFVKLGEEECEVCDLQDKHLKEDHGLDKEKDRMRVKDATSKKVERVSFRDCRKCEDYDVHINLANESRNAYRLDRERPWDTRELVISGDLMKVVMCPEFPGLKKSIFCKRIVLFNESFVPLGGNKNGKGVGVLWHEGVSGRSAQEVASVFLAYLRKNEDIKDISIWLDNCSAQGKNWWLFTALVYEVNKRCGNLHSITLKYFEPGHTFMSADTFHHMVEQGIKKKRKIENFNDFINIVEEKGKALVMKHDDFRNIPRAVSQGKFAENKPKLEDVRVVSFKRGTFKMHWRSRHYDSPMKSAEFLQRKVEKVMRNGTDFTPHTNPRGVNSAKIANIIEKLVPHMEEVKRKFWHELHRIDDLPDLQVERDPEESQDGEAES